MISTASWRLCKAFLRDRKANITIILGLSAVPVIACAGMAIDYGRWVKATSQLQAASDAAALAAANSYAHGNENYAAVAEAVLTENILNSLVPADTATEVAIDDAANTVTVNATASIPASFMRVVGINQLPLGMSKSSARTRRTQYPASRAASSFPSFPIIAKAKSSSSWTIPVR